MSLHRTRPYVLAIVFLLVAWWAPQVAPMTARAAPAPSQDQATHPRVMEQTAQAEATSSVGPQQPFKPSVTPRAVRPNVTNSNTREVFGFGLFSSLSDPNIGYPSWNFSLLSTVAVFGVHVNWDGHLVTSDSSWAVWNSSQMTNLLNTAHAAGTKVVLTIVLQDFSANTPTMCAGLHNRAVTVQQTVAEVQAKGVDGVNVDYEGLQTTCAIGDNPRTDMTDLVRQLRAALPAGSYLSVDTYASSAGDPVGFFDIPGIAPNTDSFFVMAYDSDYSNYGHAPLNCSRYCLNPISPLTGYYYNDTRASTEYSNAVPASKVILGLPYYSRADCVTAWAANQYPDNTHNFNLPYTQAVKMASDPTNNNYVLHRDAYDQAGQSPWSTWTSNSSPACSMEMYWDDTLSLGSKYSLVNSAGLRGVGLWNLNQGGGSPELWAALSAKFGSSVTYDVSQVPVNWVVGKPQTFPVRVTNTSSATWVSTGANSVDLDLHFASYPGGSGAQGYWLSSQAFNLPADVAPGATATVTVTITPPAFGHLVLEAEMIKEHEYWFAQYAPVNVYVAPPTWSASYDVSQVPTTWNMGQSQTFPVRVTNNGNQSWPSTGVNSVDLDLHFASLPGGSGAQQYWLSSKAFSLPSDVAVGQTVTVTMTWSPPGYGHLVLEAEMIKEHEFWFSQYSPVNVYVAPPTWSASYDVSQVPTSWTMGQSQTFPVKVTNTGNQAWPSTGYTAAELDLHFASYAGGSAAQGYWLSSKAFSLPSDVAPGQMVTVTMTWSPPGYGHLVLEAEMIKEHEFWFSQYAPVNVNVAPG